MKNFVDNYIVDTHLHYSPKDPLYRPEILFENEIIKKVWILSLGGTVKGFAANDEVLKLAKKYKGKIVPFAYLDLDEGPEQVIQLKKKGFAGFGEVIFSSEPYDSKKYFPVWEEIQSSDMPVVIHVGGGYYNSPRLNVPPEKAFSKNTLTLTLDVPLKLFPKIRFILAHLGGDKYSIDVGTYLVRGHNNVRGHAPLYMDLSGSHIVQWGALQKIKDAIEDVGPDAIIYGNDLVYREAVRYAIFWEIMLKTSWFRHSDWTEKIMGGNAERIIEETDWSFDNI